MHMTTEPKSVLHELDLPGVDELQVKADRLRSVADKIRQRELTHKEAGDLLDLDQPHVSALIRRPGFAVSIDVEGSDVAFDLPLRRVA